MQILIVVTHLLGSGHLKRAINLAQAFATSGHTVTLASGGYPVSQFNTDGITLEQLPPLGSDGVNFLRLLKPDGSLADEEYLASRGNALCDLVRRLEPAVVITELFPFGRRVLRQEFTSLLQAATALPKPPTILASVRDILSAPSTAKKASKTEEIISTFYQGVLVHSNASSTPLEKSWPVSGALSAKLHYTGYVAPAEPVAIATSAGHGEIVVSAGGGAVGKRVFETAVKASWLTGSTPWRVLVGGANAAAEVARLQQLGVAESMIIEPARPDFRQLLMNAICSVSLCGYNTAIDLLQTGIPGVLVPFDDGGEVEQVLRAESLSQLSSFNLLLARHLTPENLAEAVAQVMLVGRIEHSELRFDGASESVRIAVALAHARTEN